MPRALAFLLAIALPAIASAQPPPRDTPSVKPATGTGVVKGRVVDGQSGVGIARARVRIGWMGPGGPIAPVSTDESGGFVVSGLPAGSFALNVDKSTYLSTRFPEGGETLRSSFRPLTLTGGQILENVVVPMYHGGIIAGHVVDGHGDPVDYAQVQALKMPKSGRGKPQQNASTQTNDIGEFRLARLDRGKYVVMVMPRRDNMVEQPGTAFSANVEPQPLPTFYPAALSLDEAQPVAIDRGTTAANVDIALVDGTPATVSGVVVDAAGQPVTRGGSVSVRPILKDLPQNGFGGFGGGIKSDGTFTLRLAPGEYQLDARAAQAQQAPGGVNGPYLNGPYPPNIEQFGSVRMNVSADMSGVTLQLGPGARVTGRFVFDGSAAPPQAPPGGGTSPVFSSPDGVTCRMGRMQLNADWTFSADGLFGACLARFLGGYGQWAFKAILYDGKELTDQTLTFASGQRMKDVVVLFTDKRTELNLHVVDDHGNATREYVALAFPTDKSKWIDPNAGYGSRYIRTFVVPLVRVDAAAASRPGLTAERPGASRGRDTIGGLPAGEYFVIAVDDLESEAARDPETFEQLSRAATRVTIADGEPADVNLRRVTLGRR